MWCFRLSLAQDNILAFLNKVVSCTNESTVIKVSDQTEQLRRLICILLFMSTEGRFLMRGLQRRVLWLINGFVTTAKNTFTSKDTF